MFPHINNHKLHAIICTILFSLIPSIAKAQLLDFISDYVEQKVTNYVNDYIYTAGSNLWDNIIDNHTKASLREKSATLANFKGASRELKSYKSYPLIVVSNGYINTDKTLSQINQKTLSKFNKKLYSASNIKFNSMGNGKLKEKCESFLAQTEEANKIIDFASVLNDKVISTIRQQNDSVIEATLIADLNANPGLIPILNNSSKAIEFYYKLFDTNVRTSPSELLYWAEEADFYRGNMPKKTKLIKPEELKFESRNDALEIIYENNTLAIYFPQNNKYIIYAPEFLNFTARPNHEYTFENTTFITEELGRIESVQFSADKKNNKTKLKNPVKYNDIAKALTGNTKENLYTEILKQFNVVSAAPYASTIISDKKVSPHIKQFYKSYKKAIKSGTMSYIIVRFSYSDFTNVPSSVFISPAPKSMVSVDSKRLL